MKERELFSRAEDVLGLFRRGAEFTRELLGENERLRRKVAELETLESATSEDAGWERLRSELVSRVEGLERERREALTRLELAEAENDNFARRYLEVEDENNQLVNLYVASYQLHSTLDLAEVLTIVVEIVINLIGAEVFAIFALDENSGMLAPVAAEGADLESFGEVPLGEGPIGSAVASGEIHCAEAEGVGPLVCIPLRVQDRPIGAISIEKLLQQKEGFSALDYELFTMLAAHAATAMFAAQLYSQSARKLQTIRGFLELLTD